jgi:hypothetical protein
MAEFLKSLFSGPNGDISSKRIGALILIVAGVFYAFFKDNPIMCGELIGGGLALLGVAAVTKS